MRILSGILVLSVLLASMPGVVTQEVPDVLPKVIQHSEPINDARGSTPFQTDPVTEYK